jgi:aminoglycoside phosphotransferase (APT) family kinase protein
MSGAPVLVDVLPQHRLDERALADYLRPRLPGFEAPVVVRQFQGGQSNPTYAIAAGDYRYVLRKKPPGTLLPSAHAVEREYTAMAALTGSAVPVPTMRLLCEDAGVIGTPFFVMDHIEGRVFTDLTLADLPLAERAACYADLVRVMAALHAIDPAAVGLEGFGRPAGYVGRQLERWSKQYHAARLDKLPAMDALMGWLAARLPPDEHQGIVHGDFRLGNMIFHPTEPCIVAVLDWELATLGNPLAGDLAYTCLAWHLPAAIGGIADRPAPGVPAEADFIAAYARARGWESVPSLDFYIVFAMFRWAAIAAGVYRRALDGNAADARGLEAGGKYRLLAETAWAIADSQ